MNGMRPQRLWALRTLSFLAALVAMVSCGSSGKVPTAQAIQPRSAPLVVLLPADLSSATVESKTALRAEVELGSWADKSGMLASVAAALKILPDGKTDAVDCDVVTTLKEGRFDRSVVELRPKQALALQWHRLSLENVPAGAELQGANSVRFHPGHRPTLSRVQLCVKVGTQSKAGEATSEIVDHWFSFRFSEPVKASTGVPGDLIKVTPPPSTSGTCELNLSSQASGSTSNLEWLCRQFLQSDRFHVAVLPGLVGTDGSPVTTFSGATTFEADLGPVTGSCADVLP